MEISPSIKIAVYVRVRKSLNRLKLNVLLGKHGDSFPKDFLKFTSL